MSTNYAANGLTAIVRQKAKPQPITVSQGSYMDSGATGSPAPASYIALFAPGAVGAFLGFLLMKKHPAIAAGAVTAGVFGSVVVHEYQQGSGPVLTLLQKLEQMMPGAKASTTTTATAR